MAKAAGSAPPPDVILRVQDLEDATEILTIGIYFLSKKGKPKNEDAKALQVGDLFGTDEYWLQKFKETWTLLPHSCLRIPPKSYNDEEKETKKRKRAEEGAEPEEQPESKRNKAEPES